MTKLSALIITYNEERHIARCIDSLLPVADEIIVVDSYSTDRTKEICKSKNVLFIEHTFKGHIEQKNFAVSQSSNDYVLSLDADEALSPDLQQNILEEKNNFQQDAYVFNRLNNYCGQWIKYCGWYPDAKLRLWNKNKGKWAGENPHDKVVLTSGAPAKKLKGDLLHYSFSSVEEHLQQIQLFTNISSEAAYKNGRRSNLLKIIFKPIFKFLRDYIFKLGFLDGYYGFVICVNSAFAKYLKFLKLYEIQRKAGK
ncbi:MAG: glycosyltransferase family 2 protein [Saprospiraceae bacterium]